MQGSGSKGFRSEVRRKLADFVPFLAALLAIIFLIAIVVAPAKAGEQFPAVAMDPAKAEHG